MNINTQSAAFKAVHTVGLATYQLVLNTHLGLDVETLKNVVFYYVLLRYSTKARRHLWARGVTASVKDLWEWMCKNVLLTALRLPNLKRDVDAQLAQARSEIEQKMVPQGPNVTRHLQLPEKGQSLEWIMEEMKKMDDEMSAGEGEKWRHGRVSGAVYHGGDDLEKVLVAAFQRYCVSNPLHPDIFPAVRKMDAEVVAMCLRMYNNPTGAGTTTSGGTESIVMAVKAYREWGRAVKGISEPEMVIPVSAHAAFDKAAHYFNIKVHCIEADPVTRKVDLKKVKRAINSNTILIVGSAVNFPDGCMDDIPGLSQLAKRYGVGLHVDCCLGSFIMPFLEKAGFEVEPFDFRLEGVTSISCDTHKYGFAPKGSSVVMYRNAEWRWYQYYLNTEWTGGIYASPSLAGSRPGSLIAGTWAAMQYMGESGYLESCRSIVQCARKIERSIISEIPELYILGKPIASVVAFGSKDSSTLNVLEVGDLMSKRGWHLNALNKPAGLHIACTRLTVPVADEFISDLKACVAQAKSQPSIKGTLVAVYGLGNSSAVGPTIVGKLASAFLDTMYMA